MYPQCANGTRLNIGYSTRRFRLETSSWLKTEPNVATKNVKGSRRGTDFPEISEDNYASGLGVGRYPSPNTGAQSHAESLSGPPGSQTEGPILWHAPGLF